MSAAVRGNGAADDPDDAGGQGASGKETGGKEPDDEGAGDEGRRERNGGAHRRVNPGKRSREGSAGRARGGRARSGSGKQRSFWKELPILILVALVLTFTIQQFVARVYMIPSASMQQTLHGCPGCTPDRVLVDRVVYNFTEPSPGDVVVFNGPPAWTETDAPVPEPANAVAAALQQVGALVGMAPPDEQDFVKRVIATGGQTVECCDDENRIEVDGRPLEEPYLFWEGAQQEQSSFGPVDVPEDSLWMLGDNRNNSSDSRIQGGGGERGAVPVDDVVGKARVVVLPPQQWSGISDFNPQQGQVQ